MVANSTNWLELKGGPLSVSSWSLGVPCVANMVLSFSIVGCVAVKCVFATSGYLVRLSTATNNYCCSVYSFDVPWFLMSVTLTGSCRCCLVVDWYS